MARGRNFEEKLRDHLDGHPVYDEKVAADLGRICRQGNTSPEGVLQVMETLEAGRTRVDSEMRGMVAPDWYAEHDRVFMPGEVGGVAISLSQMSLDWE